MFRIWAVARHMIAESIRQKIALVGIVLVALILTVMPFAAEGDGLTLTSRVQTFLAYTLGGVGAILSVVTVFLACMAISDEISSKRVFMVATKPIPRWQFFAGKWVGIGVLNALVLLLVFGAILGVVRYLKGRPTSVAGDRETLTFEVLSARHSLELKEPDFGPEIEQRIRRMREEGRFEQTGPANEQIVRNQIRDELQKSWRSIPPRSYRRFEFTNIVIDREQEGYLHLRFKPNHFAGQADLMFAAVIRCGDPDQPNTLTGEVVENYLVDRFHTIPIPSYAVNDKGVLYVMIGNRDPMETFNFEGSDTVEVLHELGTFHWNLFRALSIVWCRLAFLAAVGLVMSSFLSFPVACMGCLLVLVVASCGGFLGTALDWSGPAGEGGSDPLWILGPVLRPLAQSFVWVVPDFSKFDADGNVVNGRLVPLVWVIQSLVVLVLVKGLIVAVAGCIVLTKRELAQVTS